MRDNPWTVALIFTAIAVMFVALWATIRPANAGPRCVTESYDSLVAKFAKRYDEYPVAQGTLGVRNPLPMTLFYSTNGTWTMIVQTPDGRFCFHGAGGGLEFFRPSLPPDGKPS